MTGSTRGFVITDSLLHAEKRILTTATSYTFSLFLRHSIELFIYLLLLINSAQTAANTPMSEWTPLMSCPQNFKLQVDGSVGPILVCGGDVIPLCFTGDNLPAGGMVSFQVDSDNDGTFEEEICSQPIPDTPCPMPSSSSGGNVFFASLIANGDGGECGVTVPESITICNGCSCDADNPDVDISGWELDDNTGGTGPGDPSHIFPAGTILASGDCITLSCNYSERPNNIWNNSSDDATLHDTSGNLIDIFSYTDDGQVGEELIGACEVNEAPICCDYQMPNDICGAGSYQFRAVVTPFSVTNCPSGPDDELDSLSNIIVANSDCPFASIEANTVVVCEAESSTAMIPISIEGGTGPYNIEYIFNGIIITGVGFNDGDMLTIPGLTTGPINVSLSSVIDLGGSECEGIVGDEEMVVDFRTTSSVTLSSATDTNDCFCNGTISLEGPSDIPFDIFYTLDGVLDTLLEVLLPATLPNFCPGEYIITGAEDDFGCVASVSGTQTVGMAESQLPIAGAEDDSVCEGQDVELIESSNDGTSWSWSGPGSFSSNLQNPVISGIDLPGVGTHTYSLTMTDANGCTGTDEIEIVVFSNPIPIAEAVDSVYCNREIIELEETSGLAAAWLWSGPSGFSSIEQNPTLTITSLPGPGTHTYSVTITDNNNCTGVDDVELVVHELPSSSIITEREICDGEDILLTENGGDAVTWQWTSFSGFSSSEQNPIITGTDLPDPGTELFELTITDNNGCTSADEIDIEVYELPSCTISTTDSACGMSNGLATGEATGGAGAYTFEWSNMATSETITDLVSGTYSLTVTDGNGCTSVCSAVVSDVDASTCSIMSRDASCGANDGSATGIVGNGAGQYIFAWSNGETTVVINDLAEGTYTLTVTDENGCSATCETIVGTSGSPSCTTTSTDTTCGESDGAVSGSVSGGVEPYTYEWSNGEMIGAITNLAADTYTLIVTDANGCTGTCSATVSAPDAPMCNTTTTDTTCGESNGTAAATAIGGVGPYAYEWSNGEMTALISNLEEGIYALTITDVNGCTNTCSATIGSSTIPVCIATSTDTPCDGNEGTATGSATGGVGPYTYSWSSGATTAMALQLVADTYTLTVTDANGCTATCETTVSVIGTLDCNAISNAPVCIGEAIQLEENAEDIDSWSWSGPNGFSSNLQNPTLIASLDAVGTYSVTVTRGAICSAICSVDVFVDSAPVTNEGAFIAACEDPFGSFMSDFTLENAENLANGDIDGDGADGSVNDVTYYVSEADALSMNNPLNNGMNLLSDLLYARVERGDCFAIEKLRLEIIDNLSYTVQSNNITHCGLSSGSICFMGLEPLSEAALRYTDPNGSIINDQISADINGEYCLFDLSAGLYADVSLFNLDRDLFCSGPIVDIEIFDAEVSSATVSDVSVCQGSSIAPIMITDNGCPITHVLIDFDDDALTDVVSLTSFAHGDMMSIPSNLALGDYTGTMTLICSNGCSVTDEFTITIEEGFSLGESTSIEICNEDPTVFLFNLFEMLGGQADVGGMWSLADNSLSQVIISNGHLGSVNLQGIMPGNYVFEYSIDPNSLCEFTPSSVTVSVISCFDLALTKVLTTAGTITPGSQVTFDITVYNQGDVDAYDVTVADYFPSCLTYDAAKYSSHTAGGTVPVIMDNTVDGFEISFIPLGESVVVTLTMTVTNNCNEATIINNAEITGGSSVDDGPIALDSDSQPNNDNNSLADIDDNNITATDGGDDFDPAILNICLLGCDGTFPWNGSN